MKKKHNEYCDEYYYGSVLILLKISQYITRLLLSVAFVQKYRLQLQRNLTQRYERSPVFDLRTEWK